ncbi:hypothetical protein J6X04_02535 [Candidatus Saccharibacteria bacterium]|nr:hypothetical protein [Candidatus Saccharibacteria bacterium]
MEELRNNNETSQAEMPNGYDKLGEEVPFIGPIPEDLKDIPENIARICLRQRETMNLPDNKHRNSYNLYAIDERYQNPDDFPPKTEDGKTILKKTIDSQEFWKPDRTKLQDYGIQRQFEHSKALSESMRAAERELGIPPTIYMLSGISAAGKTTACKKAGFPGMLYQEKQNGENGDPIGPLATDNSKQYLWMAGGSCDQIHAESSMMMRKIDTLWAEYVSQQDGDCSEVRDKTFSEIKDIEEIIQNAQETERRISDLDIDVPFIVSAVGVMLRPKGSHEPHPGFKYLRDNYIAMKETRQIKLMDKYPNSGLDVAYSLKCYDFTSSPKERQKDVAYYRKDEAGNLILEILDKELYDQAIMEPGDEEAEEIFKAEANFVGEQLVTRDFIDDYCKKYLNLEDEVFIEEIRKGLEIYVDDDNPKTVAEILNDNAKA